MFKNKGNSSVTFSLTTHLGWNEFKSAKSFVNKLIFYNLFLHVCMWCHFNDMLIMASCAWSLVWMLWNLNWIITCSNLNFGLNKGHLTTWFNNKFTFIKSLLIFIIQTLLFSKKKKQWGTIRIIFKNSKLQNNSIFKILNSSSILKLKFMSHLKQKNVMQCICFQNIIIAYNTRN